jgi:hypothetical protein
MSNWSRIQGDAVTALQAATYFAGVDVVADDGTLEAYIERRLAATGLVVAVGMPEAYEATDHGPGAIVGDVRTTVELFFNPLVNAKRTAPRNIVEAVGEVALGMIYAPGIHSQLGFRLDGWGMVANEPGLIVYAVTFSRTATLTRA